MLLPPLDSVMYETVIESEVVDTITGVVGVGGTIANLKHTP